MRASDPFKIKDSPGGEVEFSAAAASYADPSGWAVKGACQSSDPELFFPVTSHGPARRQLEKAKSVCAGCAVQAQCLEFALDTGQSFGVWGGTTEDERRSMRRKILRRRRRLVASRS